MNGPEDRQPASPRRKRPLLDWRDRDVIYSLGIAVVVVGSLAGSIAPKDGGSFPGAMVTAILIWFAALAFSIGIIGFIRRCRGRE